MSKQNRSHQNFPLRDTIFEIRFPCELAIECGRAKFYEKIRSTYSRVLVPDMEQGRSMATTPYTFEREDRSAGVMLSLSSLGLHFKKYDGFPAFRKEILRVLSIFDELFNVDELDRIGLRYVNIISYAREKGVVPIQKYLNIKIKLPELISSQMKNFSIMFEPKMEGGTITTRIKPLISKDGIHEAIVLDFDYAKTGGVRFGLLEKYIDESHQHTKRFFEALVTEDYKRFMVGDSI